VEVLLARENGFCFGVKKAVELTEAAAETGRPVHNLGQVVHNPKISERLGALGVKVIKDPSEAKEGIVVIRAHGVPPEMRAKIEAQGLECIDATCSLVLRAQRFTKQLADEGYHVIILGTPEHPEDAGTERVSHRTRGRAPVGVGPRGGPRRPHRWLLHPDGHASRGQGASGEASGLTARAIRSGAPTESPNACSRVLLVLARCR